MESLACGREGKTFMKSEVHVHIYSAMHLLQVQYNICACNELVKVVFTKWMEHLKLATWQWYSHTLCLPHV